MPATPADRRARWAVAAIFAANGAIMGTWAAHIPLVEHRLGVSHATLGVALLSMALGALIAMPLGGAAIARLGSAAMTRASTLAWLATFPLPILAPDPLLLMAALFAFGAANGVMDVAMNAHGVVVERELNRPVMSSFHGMFSLGGLVGAGLAAALLPLMPAIGEAFLMILLAGGGERGVAVLPAAGGRRPRCRRLRLRAPRKGNARPRPALLPLSGRGRRRPRLERPASGGELRSRPRPGRRRLRRLLGDDGGRPLRRRLAARPFRRRSCWSG